MRLSRIVSLLSALTLAGAVAGSAFAQQKLFVYTSMKESLVGDLKTAFAKKHPDIKLDYQSAGAGKLMAKIAAERESGKILADVLWTSEVPDFYQLKAQGLLQPYVPAESKALLQPAARLRRVVHRGAPGHAGHRLQHAARQGAAEDLGRPARSRRSRAPTASPTRRCPAPPT